MPTEELADKDPLFDKLRVWGKSRDPKCVIEPSAVGVKDKNGQFVPGYTCIIRGTVFVAHLGKNGRLHCGRLGHQIFRVPDRVLNGEG